MPVVQQRELFRFGLLGARTYAHRNYYIEWNSVLVVLGFITWPGRSARGNTV